MMASTLQQGVEMIHLDEIIENNTGPELDAFEREVESLTQEQLEQINIEEGVYSADRVKGIHRDLLEVSAAEVRWARYFAAYKKITGQPSALDPNDYE